MGWVRGEFQVTFMSSLNPSFKELEFGLGVDYSAIKIISNEILFLPYEFLILIILSELHNLRLIFHKTDVIEYNLTPNTE